MKKAGDVLSVLFDEQFIKKAKTYSNIFESWAEIITKYEIAEAADHSRIKQLEKGIMLVETDHPGWKQILQTKKEDILNEYRVRFPEMEIKSISFILGKSQIINNSEKNESLDEKKIETSEFPQTKEISFDVKEPDIDYASIKDEKLREKMIKLGQIIADKEKSQKK